MLNDKPADNDAEDADEEQFEADESVEDDDDDDVEEEAAMSKTISTRPIVHNKTKQVERDDMARRLPVELQRPTASSEEETADKRVEPRIHSVDLSKPSKVRADGAISENDADADDDEDSEDDDDESASIEKIADDDFGAPHDQLFERKHIEPSYARHDQLVAEGVSGGLFCL